MASDYRIVRGMLGRASVAYACPKCSAALKSPIEDADEMDSCPTCGATYVVPGGDERRELQRRAENHAENKRLKAENASLLAAAAKAERKAEQLETELRAASSKPAVPPASTLRSSALAACNHCGKQFARTARTCPHCAGKRPIDPLAFWVSAIILAAICGAVFRFAAGVGEATGKLIDSLPTF